MRDLKPKLFSVMKNYNKDQFVKDLISGIIVAIIALPLSIALAIASGDASTPSLETAASPGMTLKAVKVRSEINNNVIMRVRRKQGTDWRTYGCLCCNNMWNN